MIALKETTQANMAKTEFKLELAEYDQWMINNVAIILQITTVYHKYGHWGLAFSPFSKA